MRIVTVVLLVVGCAGTAQRNAAPTRTTLGPGGMKQAPAARDVADLLEADARTTRNRDLDDYLAADQPVSFVGDEVRGAGFAAVQAEGTPPAAEEDAAELAKQTQDGRPALSVRLRMVSPGGSTTRGSLVKSSWAHQSRSQTQQGARAGSWGTTIA